MRSVTTTLKTDQTGMLRRKLQERMEQLRSEILEELSRSDQESYGELVQQVHDLGDESFADLLTDINLADLDRHVGETRDIEAALQRLATGHYGRCSDCGEAVGYARLEVFPTAKRCLNCQSEHERRRGERHSTL